MRDHHKRLFPEVSAAVRRPSERVLGTSDLATDHGATDVKAQQGRAGCWVTLLLRSASSGRRHEDRACRSRRRGKNPGGSSFTRQTAEPHTTVRFLTKSSRHLLTAYDDERPAGFVTDDTPGQGTEMFLCELRR